MKQTENARLSSCVRSIMSLLVAEKYDEIEMITNGSRLDCEYLRQAIRQYGRTLIMPPNDVFEQMDIIRIRNSAPPQWSVYIDCWTREEGRSDLTLSLTLTERNGEIEVAVDDLHVL